VFISFLEKHPFIRKLSILATEFLLACLLGVGFVYLIGSIDGKFYRARDPQKPNLEGLESQALMENELLASASERSSSNLQIPLLPYDPNLKMAYVAKSLAMITDKPGGKVKDHALFGRSLYVLGWDDSRNFVKVRTRYALIGYISADAVSASKPVIDAPSADNPPSDRNRFLPYYFGDDRRFSFYDGLKIDGGESIQSSKILSDFLKLLRDMPLKPSLDLTQSDVRYMIGARLPDRRDHLVFPSAAGAVRLIRKSKHDLGVFFHPGDMQDGSVTTKLLFTKVAKIDSIVPGGTIEISLLSGATFRCERQKCDLLLPNLNKSTDSKLAQGQSKEAMADSQKMRLLFFNLPKGATPRLVRKDFQSQPEVDLAFADVNGDGEYDVAVYIYSNLGAEGVAREVGIAHNENGHWKLKYYYQD
jgi:hypothetical protein